MTRTQLATAEKLIAYVRAELELAETYAEDGAHQTALEVIKRTLKKIEEWDE